MYVLISDIARWITVILAVWLIFALIRLFFLRVRRGPSFTTPRPESLAGTLIFLTIVCSRRMETLGTPGDRYLWGAFLGTLLLLIGVLRTYQFPVPWRRGRDTKTTGRAG